MEQKKAGEGEGRESPGGNGGSRINLDYLFD
jgi:hypothetical protein